MTDDPKKKFRKAAEAIDLNLGGLLGNLGEVLGEAVQRLAEAGETDKVTEAGPIRTHTGLRVRVGGLAAKAEPQPVNPGRAAPAARHILAELIEDGAGWMVTAELPGVSLPEVSLQAEGAVLTIATTGARSFRGSVMLPAPCPVEAIAVSLVNGILTLRGGAA